MKKNIVIFSDGTGQKGGVNNNTNVYKLFNMVEDRTDNQIVYYDPGLGTDWRKISGNISGLGFSKNILDCYHFIFKNYKAGDDIYLFGFSRGAATVRSLSGFVHMFGVLPISRPDIIENAFEIYQIRDKVKRETVAQAFIAKHHTMWTKIKFVGVFDTVSALGLPNKWISAILDKIHPFKFHSFELSDSVEFARHALSIDEERKTFLPTLWDKLKDGEPKDRLKQVWFCGVHTDVGGGYAEEELSNISLRWMIQEATGKGLLIYEKAPAYQRLLTAELNIDGPMHNELTGNFGFIFRKQRRFWDEQIHGDLFLHESVLKRKKNQANLLDPAYSSWILKFDKKEIEK
ncbi:DUF2235 domain-containing protein [soil metagenome]